jgi:hypothetical protein
MAVNLCFLDRSRYLFYSSSSSIDLTRQQSIMRGEIRTETLRYLDLVTLNTRYHRDKWWHIFTDGSQIDGYINADAAIYCERFSCYTLLGQHSSAFDGEIEAIRTALRLLNLHQNKFERAVILCDSKAAIVSAGSTETVISTEGREFQVLIRQLNAKHNQIALYLIPGHCQISGNEHGRCTGQKEVPKLHKHILENKFYHSMNLLKPSGFFTYHQV